MAENENTAPEAAPQEEAPQFAVQRIYLKDASLEMPNAPEIFLAPEAPQVDIQLDVSEHGLAQPDLYEVVVRATATAKTTGRPLPSERLPGRAQDHGSRHYLPVHNLSVPPQQCFRPSDPCRHAAGLLGRNQL